MFSFFYIDGLWKQIKDRKNWITHTKPRFHRRRIKSFWTGFKLILLQCLPNCNINYEWCAFLQGYYQDEAWTIRHKISLGKKKVRVLYEIKHCKATTTIDLTNTVEHADYFFNHYYNKSHYHNQHLAAATWSLLDVFAAENHNQINHKRKSPVRWQTDRDNWQMLIVLDSAFLVLYTTFVVRKL